MFYINFILIFVLSLTIRITRQQSTFEQHAPKEIDDHNLAKISNTITNIEQLHSIIDRILIPRVVGTEGHELVKDFIIQSMQQLQWTVETDIFQENTPNLGVLTFTNIIATMNPNADEFLLIACHYDSKYFPNEEFLGATDSAVPCAMMISIAMTLEKYLKQMATNENIRHIGLKYVFFDGEEAFLQWSSTDSIYGARHLAAKWESEGFLPKIHMLMLLDLLGAPDPNFYSFFKSTENWYVRFCVIEERLANAGLMDKYTSSSAAVSVRRSSNTYFQTSSSNSYIEDDHIPFLQRGVPILHLIPTPFPKVWHKMTDDRQAIDIDTVENLNRILRIFIIEYFHIEV